MKTIKCSECGKEYDYNLNVCPHCGYDNKIKKEKQRIIKIILIAISVLLLIISLSSILKGGSDKELQEYYEKYGSEEFGSVAYSLNRVRFSTLGVGIAMLWVVTYLKNKNLILSKILKYLIITVLVITQFLPLGYAIYLKNLDTDTLSNNNNSTYASEYCKEDNCTNKRESDSEYCSLHRLYPIKEY